MLLLEEELCQFSVAPFEAFFGVGQKVWRVRLGTVSRTRRRMTRCGDLHTVRGFIGNRLSFCLHSLKHPFGSDGGWRFSLTFCDSSKQVSKTRSGQEVLARCRGLEIQHMKARLLGDKGVDELKGGSWDSR